MENNNGKDRDNKEIEENKYGKLTFVLIVLLICMLGYLGYSFYNDYQTTIANYEERINNLNSSVSSITQELNNYKAKVTKMNKQIEFMDEHVSICPIDGSGLYHRYGCEHLDTSHFYIFNSEQAPNEGYSACPYCNDLSNTYTSWDAYKEKMEKTEIVYVTNTGSKYHRAGCSYLKSKKSITKEQAISQGYSPCNRCNP